MISTNFKISVIMPVFNSQETVLYTIKSVVNQTYDNFEFIIVNDGSTDNSEEIILSVRDKRIKYYKIDHRGRSYASNFGISKTTSNYIARIDSDDLFFRDKLMKQMKVLTENKEIDILYCWSIFFKDFSSLRFWKSPEYDREIKEKLRYLNPINHSSVIYKKNLITKMSGYNEKIEINEDYELWIRASKDLTFYCMQEYLVFSKLKDEKFKKQYNSKLVYLLTQNIRSKSFISSKEKNDLLGRVEYYYGNINSARKILFNGNIFKNVILIFFTFIPNVILNNIKGKRLSLLLTYDIFKIYNYRKKLKILLNK